ncbi:MAG: hypothetical protein ACJAXJ_001194 [Colwellia sp.]|jgi:hypothetical protein
MKVSELKKDKKILGLIAVGITALAVGGYLFFGTTVEAPVSMDFSKKTLKEKANSINVTKSNRVVKPDPAYKEAPEFEDFQAIAKMWVHAMKPFQKEVKAWEADIISLRLQREKIKLFQDGALAAEGEADMYKWKDKTAKYKRGEGALVEKSDKELANTSSEDIMNFDNLSDNRSINTEYQLSNIRLSLFSPGNKYSKTAASFSVGKERFYSVKANQVFASQFLVLSLDDNNFCALVEDLNTDQQSRVCRN